MVRAVRHKRAKPGARGSGRFFHVQVRPRTRFVAFRIQKLGKAGAIERVAGRRADGSWDTQKWLIGKSQAHLDGNALVADTAGARKVIAALGSVPRHLGGDRFIARPRRDIPEREKPTRAMRRARQRNIKKAQAAWRNKHARGGRRT